LQILDDGRVTDAKGRSIDFRNAIVVLTTNLDRDELEMTLRSELLDRLDEVVVFAALGTAQIEQIVALQIRALADRIGAHAIVLELSGAARSFLASTSMASGNGARDVARSISRFVATPLSSAMLRGELAAGQTAKVEYDGSTIVVRAA
jgi:ATP-dependent Clp protease ATP-binding subunit ClpA